MYRTSAIVDASGSDDVGYVIADMSDFDSVRAVAVRLSDEFDVLDVLVHNAGSLTPNGRWRLMERSSRSHPNSSVLSS